MPSGDSETKKSVPHHASNQYPTQTQIPPTSTTAATTTSLKRGRSRNRTILPLMNAEWARREGRKKVKVKTLSTGNTVTPAKGDEGALAVPLPIPIQGATEDIPIRYSRSTTQTPSIHSSSSLHGSEGTTENAGYGSKLDDKTSRDSNRTVKPLTSVTPSAEAECPRRPPTSSHYDDIANREFADVTFSLAKNKKITSLGHVIYSDRVASPRVSPPAAGLGLNSTGAVIGTPGLEASGSDGVRINCGKQALMSSISSTGKRQPLRDLSGNAIRPIAIRSISGVLNRSYSQDQNAYQPPSAPTFKKKSSHGSAIASNIDVYDAHYDNSPVRPASSLGFYTPYANPRNPSSPRNAASRKTRDYPSGNNTSVSARVEGAKAPDLKAPKTRLEGKVRPLTSRQETNVVIISPALSAGPSQLSQEDRVGAFVGRRRGASLGSHMTGLAFGSAGANDSEIGLNRDKGRCASMLLKSIQDREMESLANMALESTMGDGSASVDNGGYTSDYTTRTNLQRHGSLGSARRMLDMALMQDKRVSSGEASINGRSEMASLPFSTKLKRAISQGAQGLRRSGAPIGLRSTLNANETRSSISHDESGPCTPKLGARRMSETDGQWSYTRWDGQRTVITEQDHPFHWNYLMRRNSRSDSVGLPDSIPSPMLNARKRSGKSLNDGRHGGQRESLDALIPDYSHQPRASKPPPSAYKGSPAIASVRRPTYKTSRTFPTVPQTASLQSNEWTFPISNGSSTPGLGDSTSNESLPRLGRSSTTASFDSRSAYEAVKGKDGYISFDNVEGLGGEEEAPVGL